YVLVEVAERLTRSMPLGSLVARHGGDEFVAIVSCTDVATAHDLGTRIVRAIEVPFLFAGVEHRLSASVGIAHSPGGTATARQMLREADHAVYVAKERPGAGQVATFDEPTRRSAD